MGMEASDATGAAAEEAPQPAHSAAEPQVSVIFLGENVVTDMRRCGARGERAGE